MFGEEGKTSEEHLKSMIKDGAVENYSKTGYTTKGKEELMDVIRKTKIDEVLGLTQSPHEPEGYTNIALVPLSSPYLAKKVEGLNPKDVAICIAFYANNIDQHGRSGTFTAVAIMSQKDGEEFLRAVEAQPDLVYKLIRNINGGPIVRCDGSPADIKPGKAVNILPNNKVGGSISKETQSAPFDQSFEPNPLF